MEESQWSYRQLVRSTTESRSANHGTMRGKLPDKNDLNQANTKLTSPKAKPFTSMAEKLAILLAKMRAASNTLNTIYTLDQLAHGGDAGYRGSISSFWPLGRHLIYESDMISRKKHSSGARQMPLGRVQIFAPSPRGGTELLDASEALWDVKTTFIQLDSRPPSELWITCFNSITLSTKANTHCWHVVWCPFFPVELEHLPPSKTTTTVQADGMDDLAAMASSHRSHFLTTNECALHFFVPTSSKLAGTTRSNFDYEKIPYFWRLIAGMFLRTSRLLLG